MMNLMTILVKKVFISSKPTFVYLLCPPLCGPFSIQESAAGGLSYKVKKRMCLGTFSRLARSLATVYIFARVRIFGTSVPFSDLPSVPSPTHSAGESSGTDALCREPGFLLARRRMRWRTGGTCLSVSELCRLFSAFSILLQA